MAKAVYHTLIPHHTGRAGEAAQKKMESKGLDTTSNDPQEVSGIEYLFDRYGLNGSFWAERLAKRERRAAPMTQEEFDALWERLNADDSEEYHLTLWEWIQTIIGLIISIGISAWGIIQFISAL